MNRKYRRVSAYVLLLLGMSLPAFANQAPSDSGAAGWYVAASMMLIGIGYAVRILISWNDCKKCGLVEIKDQINGIEWLVVELCEKNGITADKRRDIMDRPAKSRG